MDRREAKEMYGQVLQQIQAGDPMAAYSIFEQMPFPDQMAMFMTPGVGDAIAAVEAGVFNERSKENFAQGNIGSGLMDAGIGGLAMASTIPFVGKAAELGSMGVRGLRNLRSMRGDGMSGGGGGGRKTVAPKDDVLAMEIEEVEDMYFGGEIDFDEYLKKIENLESLLPVSNNPMTSFGGQYGGKPLNARRRINQLIARKNDMIEENMLLNERAPAGTFRIDDDKMELIDEEILRLERINAQDGIKSQRTMVFKDDGIVSAANKVDAEIGRLIDKGFEGDNFMNNQNFSVPVKMQAMNRKTGEMIEVETMPSEDGSIGLYIAELGDSKKPVSMFDNPAISKIMRIEEELRTETLAPATRKRLEAELRSLKAYGGT